MFSANRSWIGCDRLNKKLPYSLIMSQLSLKLRTIKPQVHSYWFLYKKACYNTACISQISRLRNIQAERSHQSIHPHQKNPIILLGLIIIINTCFTLALSGHLNLSFHFSKNTREIYYIFSCPVLRQHNDTSFVH